MIRKDDSIMANKKDITVEELQKACDDAKKTFEALQEQLTIAKREEEDRKKAELALQREARQKEVDDAIEKAKNLLQAFVKDYGSYSNKYDLDDYGLFPKTILPWWC